MANIWYAGHCSKQFTHINALILKRSYEVCAIVTYILQIKLLVSKVTLVTGTVRIQTQAVWLPEILIADLKEEWITETYTEKANHCAVLEALS